MRNGVVALLLVLACGLALPCFVGAAVRTGSITLNAPSQPPSLNPQQPPAYDQEPYVHTASLAYDDAAGTVTGTFSFYDPQAWANTMFGGLDLWTLTIKLADTCTSGSVTKLLTFNTGPHTDANYTFRAAWASATLSGYQGSVYGTGGFDGTNWSTVLQSPYFAHLDLRCVEFSAFDSYSPDAGGANDFDSGARWLNGYGPQPPPPSPKACKTYERDILRYAPNHIQSWHGLTCQAAKQVLRRSRIVNNGNLHVPGFRCRVRHRYQAGPIVTGANVSCAAPGKWFLLMWAT